LKPSKTKWTKNSYWEWHSKQFRESLYILKFDPDKPPSRKNRRRTKPEKAMCEILQDLFIEYEIEYPIAFCRRWKYYDFKIGENILIEVDGDYIHGNSDVVENKSFLHKKNQKNDTEKNFIARVRGYKLLRFWESDLYNQPDYVKDNILDAVHNETR